LPPSVGAVYDLDTGFIRVAEEPDVVNYGPAFS
jgi:hypothetical protein